MRPPTSLRAAPFAAVLALLAAPAFAGGFDPPVADRAGDVDAVTAPADATPVIGTLSMTDTQPAADAPAIDAPAIDAGPAFGTALPSERLETMRGGDGNVSTTTNRADIRGNVGGNSATNVIAGGNGIADGSFGNAAGISTVIQNSGSNVLIQNSTIVNVQFVPTP